VSGGDDEAAAPSLAEKLAAPRVSSGRARQTVAQLARRWQVVPFAGTPETITVRVAHGTGLELWRRCSTGAAAVYEMDGLTANPANSAAR